MNTYFGIDFGSKYTGNTVIAVLRENKILFLDVDKNVDADNFILNANDHFKPKWIFIDAPLSLPGVYTNIDDLNNFHFREADKACKAMSPMFLGGMLARAMELKEQLEDTGAEVFETYPKIMAQRFGLNDCGYKTSKGALKNCASRVAARFKPSVSLNVKEIKTWHHLDALFALMSAMAYELDQCEKFGNPKEGLIYV